jgi:hypothetical protein
MELDFVFIGVVITAMVIAIFGGSGASLIAAGWPRRFRHPTCGACRADVSESIGDGACAACGRSFAQTGVVPPRLFVRPILLLIGSMLTLTALGFLVFVLLETFYL